MPKRTQRFSKMGLQLDTVDTIMRTSLAHALALDHRYSEALSQLKTVLSKSPNNSTAHLLLGEVYLNQVMWRRRSVNTH